MTVERESSTEQHIRDVAQRLKALPELKPPEWSSFVKTGVHNQRPPQDPDWWWIRAAAVLRKIERSGSLGTQKLRKVYGGRKNRGHKPEHKFKASGSVLRKILQQLESAGLVSKTKKHGRAITQKGSAMLLEAAKGLKGKS
ncbi:MAG: 30S ribosomal protein S19e [Candidatus Aenigmarchaeota archaeon]|nr:30S ribosomal protein S19e [Candidatus Aenigmarchaeota archaeon]